MNEWIDQILFGDSPGLAVIPAAFLVGILGALTSACNLALIAGIAGGSYTLADKGGRKGVFIVGLFFMLGTVVALGIIGAVTGFVGETAGASLGRYWKIAAGVIIIGFGLASLNLLPIGLPSMRLSGTGERSAVGSMLYGLALGGGTATCAIGCNPVLPMALGYATLQGNTGWGAAILASFAVGYGLPLAAAIVGLGMGLGRLTRLAQKAAPVMSAISGALLLAVGFYLLVTS